MAKKSSFKHFRDRDAPTDWIRPLEEVSFSKVIKKDFNQLNQLSLWEEEEVNELGITKFHAVE